MLEMLRTGEEPGQRAATAPCTSAARSASPTAASTSAARSPPARGAAPRPGPRRGHGPFQSTRCHGRSGGGPQRAGGTGEQHHRRGPVRGGQVGDAGVAADHQPGVRRPARPARRGRCGRRAPPSAGSPAARGHPLGQRPARPPSRSPPPGAPGRRSAAGHGGEARRRPALARAILRAGMHHRGPDRHPVRPRAGAARGRRGRLAMPYQASSRHHRATSCSSSRPRAGRRRSRPPGRRTPAAGRAGRPAAAGATRGPRPCRFTATARRGRPAAGRPARRSAPAGRRRRPGRPAAPARRARPAPAAVAGNAARSAAQRRHRRGEVADAEGAQHEDHGYDVSCSAQTTSSRTAQPGGWVSANMHRGGDVGRVVEDRVRPRPVLLVAVVEERRAHAARDRAASRRPCRPARRRAPG